MSVTWSRYETSPRMAVLHRSRSASEYPERATAGSPSATRPMSYSSAAYSTRVASRGEKPSSLPIATARSAVRSAWPDSTWPAASGSFPNALIVWRYARRVVMRRSSATWLKPYGSVASGTAYGPMTGQDTAKRPAAAIIIGYAGQSPRASRHSSRPETLRRRPDHRPRATAAATSQHTPPTMRPTK